jgi:hypothetical protein
MDRRRTNAGKRRDSTPDPPKENVTGELIKRIKTQKKHNIAVIVESGRAG